MLFLSVFSTNRLFFAFSPLLLQIRSLITKVADDGRIHYRALTDAELTSATARSKITFSEIDDDEYLLELIRGGDAVLEEGVDNALPSGRWASRNFSKYVSCTFRSSNSNPVLKITLLNNCFSSFPWRVICSALSLLFQKDVSSHLARILIDELQWYLAAWHYSGKSLLMDRLVGWYREVLHYLQDRW